MGDNAYIFSNMLKIVAVKYLNSYLILTHVNLYVFVFYFAISDVIYHKTVHLLLDETNP